MLQKIYIVGAIIFISIYFSSSVEAGCNGRCEVVNGQDWIVDVDTHMWNEEIEVKNLEVLNGASLKLENVTIKIQNHATLSGKTEWIESNITLYRQDVSNNVTVYDELSIISSEVLIFFDRNNSGSYGETNTEGIYLASGGFLSIRDLDGNPETDDDATVIKPYGYNVPANGWDWFATWEIMGDQSNTSRLEIKNSILIDIWQSRVYGHDPLITGNHFIGTRDIFFYGDNLVYTNNSHNAKELNVSRSTAGGVRAYDGDKALISNNSFINGGSTAIDLERRTNVSITNNQFSNLGSNVIWAGYKSSNITVNNNYFESVNTAIWAGNVSKLYFYDNNIINGTFGYSSYFSGSSLRVNNNNFTNCPANCLVTSNLNYHFNENIFITNNSFRNYNGNGILLGTGGTEHSNITVANNTFFSAASGINIGTYNGQGLPENVNIIYNTFTNTTNAITLESYSTWGIPVTGGSNYLIFENLISGANKGITGTIITSSYAKIRIKNNSFNVLEYGLDLVCDGSSSPMKNTRIVNNNIKTENMGLSLRYCDGETLISANEIDSSRIGINLFQSQSTVENNEITGNCLLDSCSKVSFTKVAETGINVDSNSRIAIKYNNLKNFFITLETKESSIIELTGNSINFTQTGIKSDSSEIVSAVNHINNTYYGLRASNSNLYIDGLHLNTFDIGIDTFNSTTELNYVVFNQGRLCMTFVDSNYTILNYQNLNCGEAVLYEKYFLKIKIQTNEGIPSPQHQFQFIDYPLNTVNSGYTNENGISDYYLVTVKKIDNAGLTTSFNPFTISYAHNGIDNSKVVEIRQNATIIAELDTTPPQTKIEANATILSDNNIHLNFIKISDRNDLLNYDIFVLVNDGINFAEWSKIGTFNTSIVEYEVENGIKYRFKSISRDIYGNEELKNGYDYEVEIDTEKPVSYFDYINANYYFANEDDVLIKIGSHSNDVEKYEIIVEYTNFTTSYLDQSTVVWTLIEKKYFYQKDEFVYQLSNEGHYGFKIEATDNAGNIESKDQYDFVINYDPNSDTLSFEDIPERWGSEYLEINLANSDFNLDFQMYLAMESLNYENPYFTWYEHPSSANNEIIILQGLLDKTRYYLYAESTDLAGNVENPLNTTEYFSSNGEYDQEFSIQYIPLIMDNYNFIVEIDNNLDGDYETSLVPGRDFNSLESNEFYVDKKNKTLHFGGIMNGGFVPNQDINKVNNIRVSYSGVHAIFEVYTGNPQPAQNLEIKPTNTTHIIFEYNVPTNSDNCKVQRTTNVSKGWFNQEILSPCLKGIHVYEHLNPDPNSRYFYRILIEDEFGHVSVSENRSVDMTDVVKIYNADNAAQSDQSIDSVIILTATVGALMLGVGGVLLYRTKNSESLDDNVTTIESKPVAKYKVEELYLIYKDGRLIKNISAVEVKTDSDIMSGMLTAINDFVQDSFNTEGDLGDIGYGNNKIILQRGNNSYLAAVIYGEVDNYFKGKMINAVRSIENKNPSMASWNGDSESIGNVRVSLKPIMDETSSVSKEMVDNYFTEKDLVITTDSEKIGDIINLKVNISNYSSSVIQNCRIKPEINTSILSIMGIEPDLAYHFNENSFNLGEIDSYNEVNLEIKLRAKKSEDTAVEIKMNYEMKGKEGDLSSVAQIN